MTIIDGSVLSQGRQITVENIATRILTDAELLTAPTVAVAIVSGRPSVLLIPHWFTVLAINNAVYTNEDAGASVIFDWSAAPIGGTGFTAAIAASLLNSATPALLTAGMQAALVFSGALMSRVGAAINFRVANGALGNYTGGNSGNRWLVSVSYQAFQVPGLATV